MTLSRSIEDEWPRTTNKCLRRFVSFHSGGRGFCRRQQNLCAADSDLAFYEQLGTAAGLYYRQEPRQEEIRAVPVHGVPT